MIADHTNKRYCLNLGELAKLLIAWHTMDNRETRSSTTTWVWNLGQCNGGYMAHVCSFMKLLFDVQALERAGYSMTDDAIRSLEDDVTMEDQFANFFGTGIFSIVGHRTRRNLKRMVGYPDCLCLMHIPEKAEGILKRFRWDCKEDYHTINNHGAAKTRKCQEALDRHVVHKVSVQQHLLVGANVGWVPTTDQADV